MRRDSKRVAGRLGVVIGNVVGLRDKPDSDSEQATQAIMGQRVVAEAGQGDWLFVQTWDTFRAWVHSRSIRLLEDGVQPYASTGAVAVIRELIVDILSQPHERAEIVTKATISAEIEVAASEGDWVELRLPDGRAGFIQKHQARLVDLDAARTIWLPEPRKLIETAERFIGTPYLWGGTTPFGLDCSGLVQLIHRIHNVTLLRNSRLQAADPRAVPVDRKKLAAGDLVFFATQPGPDANCINHVGMALDNSRFIHSCGAGGVTITPLDEPRYAAIYWDARRMRLATLDPGGGAPED